MDFAFYNETEGDSLGGRVLTPARRAMRRVLRPAFVKLRELLQHFSDKQDAAELDIRALVKRMNEAESRLSRTQGELARLRDELVQAREELAKATSGLTAARKSYDLARPLSADYKALATRVDGVEDRLIDRLVAARAA